MTLRRFIDVAFALLVEFHTSRGIDLFTALDNVSAVGRPQAAEAAAVPAPVDNAKSMEALMGALSGVKGAPV